MNALTVDVEDYFQTNGLNIPPESWNSYESRVDMNTRRLLDCFDRNKVKGTFFIVGSVAQQYPELVVEIISRGHEIGSHSGLHRMLAEMSEDDFREDVRSTKKLLEDISGRAVYQYRAPSWSMDRSRYGWLGILEEEGYLIDSSIQPFQTPLSGSNKAPIEPFHPIIQGRRYSIIEFPSTVYQWGPIRIPFSGGTYFRALPLWLSSVFFRLVNEKRTGMLYIHPWEIDPEQPHIQTSPLIRFAQYYRLIDTEQKLDLILNQFSFQPLGSVVEILERNMKIPDIVLK